MDIHLPLEILKLKKTLDYKKLSSNCHKVFSKSFILLYGTNDLIAPNSIRVGITVTKKIGNAVKRNKCKRIIRSLTKEVLPLSDISQVDINIIAKVDFLSQNYLHLKREVEFCTKKIKENN